MMYKKIRIGDFVEIYNEKCNIKNLTPDQVSGISKDKEFFEPSKQVGKDTSNYKIVPPNYFACNLMHVGRDKVLPISLNHTDSNKIVSPAYTVFKITDESLILKEYFFMTLKSDEKDRFFWFHTDSSVRDGMDWNVFCDIEMDVPDIPIQEKFVNIYKGLLSNLDSYQKSLDDLELSYKIAIENIGKREEIGSLIIETNEKNEDGLYSKEKGVSIKKQFITTKSSASDISKQKVVHKNWFAFNSNTSRNSDTLSIAVNLSDPCIVSNTYVTFKCNEDIINPKYLYLWFCRSEFDRYARFNSWGSARETIAFKEIQKYKISVPDLEKQNDIVKLYESYFKRVKIVESLKKLINDICPILIRGSLKEAMNGQ